jgi:hypothetical protein
MIPTVGISVNASLMLFHRHIALADYLDEAFVQLGGVAGGGEAHGDTKQQICYSVRLSILPALTSNAFFFLLFIRINSINNILTKDRITAIKINS